MKNNELVTCVSDTSNVSKGKAYFVHGGLGLCPWLLSPVQVPTTLGSVTLCWDTQSWDNRNWTEELKKKPGASHGLCFW